MAATYRLNLNGVKMKTTGTNTTSFVDIFITELVLSCDYSASTAPIIGFDVEFRRSDDKTSNCKPATLQLCSRTRCIIVQLSQIRVVPQSLRNLMSASLFCFAGVGVREMFLALRGDCGLGCRNFDSEPILDLALFSGYVKAEPKPLSIVMGNWVPKILAWTKLRVLLMMLIVSSSLENCSSVEQVSMPRVWSVKLKCSLGSITCWH